MSVSVVEHLHPDDLVTHFTGAYRILKAGGRYVLGTCHVTVGPGGISRVFGRSELMGMHLKEYTYAEIASAMKQAGFGRICSVLRLPKQLRRMCGMAPWAKARASTSYLDYLTALERAIALLPDSALRQRAARAPRFAGFTPNMTVVAGKGQYAFQRSGSE